MTSGPPSAVTPGAPEDVVRLRSPRYMWVLTFVVAGFSLLQGLSNLFWQASNASSSLETAWWRTLITLQLVVGCLGLAAAFWVRSRGVDLTRELALVRGIRRRAIPWPEVQAVIAMRRGTWCLRLILDSGESVLLPAPRSAGLAAARYEREFHLIGQWWLAHRGESWRPVRPEAPRLPVQR